MKMLSKLRCVLNVFPPIISTSHTSLQIVRVYPCVTAEGSSLCIVSLQWEIAPGRGASCEICARRVLAIAISRPYSPANHRLRVTVVICLQTTRPVDAGER